MKFQKKHSIALISAGLMSAQVAFAQPTLEEVMVTAQKRAEGLGDVPISIMAVTGDNLENQGINDMSQLVDTIPNVTLQTSPNFSFVSVRGVSSGGANFGFEQAVGMYIDGLYVNRGLQANAPFLDVERVEVLRGPQGVLQGKNSIAGAVVITTRRPSNEFEGFLRGGYELENGGYNAEAAVSGPLTDNFSGRVVLSTTEVGGWLDTLPRTSFDGSTQLSGNKDQNESTVDTFRVSGTWEPTDTLSVFAKYEYGEKETRGAPYGSLTIQPGAEVDAQLGGGLIIDDYLNRQPGYDTFDNDVAVLGRVLVPNADGNGFVPIDKEQNRTVDSDAFVLQLDWEHEIGTVSAITTYSEFEAEILYANFDPFEFLSANNGEEFEQITQELRLVSPGGQTIDYVVGLYYLDQDMKIPGAESIVSLSSGHGLPAAMDVVTTRNFHQTTESISVFGQVTWNISDVLRLNAGLRYSDEEKTLEDYSLTAHFPVVVPPLNQATLDRFGLVPFTIADIETDKIEDDTVDPSVSLQWDITDEVMLYGSYTGATKAGGFDSQANTADKIIFEPEEAEGYELGLKSTLMDGRLMLNLTLFQTEFTNQQISVLDSATNSLVVLNAGESTTEGLEVETRFAATDNLELGAAFAYLDASYDSFPGAPCSPGLSEEPNCDPETNTRDAAGDKLANAPEWSGSLYAQYYYPLSSGASLRIRGDAFYSDDYFLSVQNDDYASQDSFTKVDLSLGYVSAAENWSVSIVGRNVTDERTSSFGGGTLTRDGAYWANADAPRTITLIADWRF